MHIREYQEWLQDWDKLRNWDKVLISHTMLHAMEEMGEVSRLVQVFEGYRGLDEATLDEVRSDLALELNDLQVMLFKIAYLCGIDMESAMKRGQVKADDRFPDINESRDELEAYRRRFREYMTENNID